MLNLTETADTDLIRWIRDPGNPVIASPPGEAGRPSATTAGIRSRIQPLGVLRDQLVDPL